MPETEELIIFYYVSTKISILQTWDKSSETNYIAITIFLYCTVNSNLNDDRGRYVIINLHSNYLNCTFFLLKVELVGQIDHERIMQFRPSVNVRHVITAKPSEQFWVKQLKQPSSTLSETKTNNCAKFIN